MWKRRAAWAFVSLALAVWSIPFGVAAHARGLGLLGLDLLPRVRRSFARHAMGRAGRLPRLARGIPLSRIGDQE